MKAAAKIAAKDLNLGALAKRINAEHELFLAVTFKGLEHARNVGEMLTQAKEEFAHGEWLPWVEKNLSFGKRQAQKYMRLAERWKEIKANRDALLGIDAALRLLVDDLPELWEMPAPTQERPVTAEEAADLVESVLAGLSPEEQLEAVEVAEERIERRAVASEKDPVSADRKRCDRALKKLDGAHKDVSAVSLDSRQPLKKLEAAQAAVEGLGRRCP